MPEILGDQVNEFSVAVVLRNGVGSSAIHATGNFAVVELISGVPVDEVRHFLVVAEPEKCGRCERAVAYPGALV
jgi:hypothetical protein